MAVDVMPDETALQEKKCNLPLDRFVMRPRQGVFIDRNAEQANRISDKRCGRAGEKRRAVQRTARRPRPYLPFHGGLSAPSPADIEGLHDSGAPQ
jgi:hypothetical protein